MAMTDGQPTVGILMLEGKMARQPGCMGQAASFPYPVLYEVVEGSRGPSGPEDVPALVPGYVEAAKKLEAAGARVITDNCNGPMVMMQDELAGAVRVPVVTSGLLLVPLVHAMTPGRRIGVLTFFVEPLGEWHYRACGWSSRDVPIAVGGVGRCESWLEFLRTKEASEDLAARMEADLVAEAGRLLDAHPDIGAWVLECTLLPPASQALREALGLPVYDVLNLIDLAAAGYFRPAAAGP